MGQQLSNGAESVSISSVDYKDSGKTPVTFSLSSSTQSPSFTPRIGREVNLTLSGTWTGSAALEHQLSDGNWYPCTIGGVPLVWTANMSEPVWVETVVGAILRINLTYGSGTCNGRVEH